MAQPLRNVQPCTIPDEPSTFVRFKLTVSQIFRIDAYGKILVSCLSVPSLQTNDATLPPQHELSACFVTQPESILKSAKTHLLDHEESHVDWIDVQIWDATTLPKGGGFAPVHVVSLRSYDFATTDMNSVPVGLSQLTCVAIPSEGLRTNPT